MTDPMLDLVSRPDSQFDDEEHLKSQNQEKQPKQEQLENGKQEHAASAPTPKPHNLLPNTFTISGEYEDNNMNPILSSVLVVLYSILPPHLRAAILETALTHPLLTTFFLCQFVCSCIPVIIFLIGATIAGAIAVVVFSCFALLVLGPVLVATTVTGLFLWGWGWVTFVVGRWLVRQYLSEDGDGEKDRARDGVNGFNEYDAEKVKEESA
ncbi:seipin co-factor family protein [Aspergillus fischeri NRRL 181]|uniref:Uncharacterized protein n=1 Tax=Neosartorya fischeri (strain ATCC 1020 / DSM 3700 / CBS 544.65 / FGSC A1164 / JCM 1740 / NRRL 181 / WB 181) TaxID=331117 RepID=A1DF24_NEOFI|nr:conserved hypothetical protein [Aspergillus fischeri NRRL 181]EAW17981.1 conserved hypothetical protein [Aspergillus fischeri NRRL 181]KAG2016741.1 hypothetical protein GB937_006221 [Aspergillus fischeri]